MRTITTTIHIRRPPVEVFAFLIKPTNWLTFASGLVDVNPKQPLEKGSQGVWTRKQGGRAMDYRFTVVDCDSPSRLTFHVVGPGMTAVDTTTLTADEQGTRATFVETLTPTTTAMRVMLLAFGALIRITLRRDYLRLKAHLEAPATA